MDSSGHRDNYTDRNTQSIDIQSVSHDSDDKRDTPESPSPEEPDTVRSQEPGSTTGDGQNGAANDHGETPAEERCARATNEARAKLTQKPDPPTVGGANGGFPLTHSSSEYSSEAQFNLVNYIYIIITIGYLTGYILLIAPIILNVASILTVASGCILLLISTILCLAIQRYQNNSFKEKRPTEKYEKEFIDYPSDKTRANALRSVTIISCICESIFCTISISKLCTMAPTVESNVAYIVWGALALLGLLLIAISPLLLFLHSKRERDEEGQWYQTQLQAELDLRWRKESQRPNPD